MIKKLEIENFKSIKHLKLDCRRVNVFIGEPNTGKSNILESIGLLSHIHYGQLKEFVRFEMVSNLFYDGDIEKTVKIGFNDSAIQIGFKDGLFTGSYFYPSGQKKIFSYNERGDGTIDAKEPVFNPFKFYRFSSQCRYDKKPSDFLLPPSGENLFMTIRSRGKIKTQVKDILEPFGLKFMHRELENKGEVVKETEGILISYPYSTISDTLKRVVFYISAIYSNKDSVIVFEEPESHAFPYYARYLAELIAFDKNNNQYFITTHNPYFVLSILEKTPKDEIRIFIVHFEDYQTKVTPVREEDMKELMMEGMDFFLNLDRFRGKE